ncbi:hypothetical protein ACFSN5_04195 [Streptococcus tangpeifui]|uniref:phage holin family protein n=1 Tax=Streptococcus tangpeifui TaxID=2709400 RepID=UPI0013EAC707|nr:MULTISPECIES: phage holin family protein [unclassified Streptococcus]
MNNKEAWVKQFEALTGRKPTAEEFAKAKETDFNLEQLTASINANQANAQASDVGVSPETAATENAQVMNQANLTEDEATQSQGVPAGQTEQASQDQAVIPNQQIPNDLSQQQAQVGQMPQGNESQRAFGQPQNFQQQAFSGVQSGQNHSNQVLDLILPIVSLVLSVLFAAFSFTVVAPVFLGLSVLGLIFAIVLLILNLKGKKLLSIIASAVALLAVLISIVGLVVSNSRHSVSKSDNSSSVTSNKNGKVKDNSTDVNDYTDKNYKFEWKQDDVSDLKVESDTVADVVKKHGKATEAEISGDELTLRYEDKSKEDTEQKVTVSFEKGYDGTWVISYIDGIFEANDIDTNASYKSDWTKADFDALKVGDDETGAGGASWSDVKSKHAKPSAAYYTVRTYSADELEKGLTIEYEDFDADDSHAQRISLEFTTNDDGDTYHLSYKYGYGAGISND